MRTRGRLGGTLLALVLALGSAGAALAASGGVTTAAHRVAQAVTALPQTAVDLGHSGHPAVGKPQLHAPGVPAASTAPAGVAVAALVALVAAAAVVTRGGRRFLRPVAIRAPPRRQ